MNGRYMRFTRPLVATAVAATLFPALASAITISWTGGDFVSDVTAPDPLTALDILEIGAGTPKRFVGGTFTNLSLVRWLADPLQGGNGAVVTNTGEWRSESDANTLNWTFGGQALFINSHVFSKSAGTTTNVGTWLFRNDGGIIEAQTGSIVFNSASNIFNTGSRFTGAGSVAISGGSTFNGDFQSDNLAFSGGSQIGNAAVLTGGAGLTSGLLGWTGGDLNGTWTLGAGTTLVASGAATKRQIGSTIINNGTFRWSTTQQLQGGNSSSFTNNALVEATESALFNWNVGGQHVFVNNASGTVRAANNATLTFGPVALTSHGGLFEASAGSAIEYSGVNNLFNDGTRFLGLNRVTGGARFVDDIASDDLRFVSGTQFGGDGVTPGSRALLSGVVGFEGGDLSGAWEIKAGAVMTGSGASTKRQIGSDIINNGTFRWATTQQLQGGNSSLFTNNGLVEVTESALFNWNVGGQHVFVNNATGTVRATNNAALNFGGLALTSHGGLFEAGAGSSIEYSGASNRFNDGTRFVGLNRVTGSARFVDTIASDDLRFISGTQTGGDGVTAGSRARLSGAVGFAGGDLSGAWEIKAGAVVTGSGVGTKRQVGSDIINNGTFRWVTTQTLQGGNGSVFTNNALVEVSENALFNWNFGGQHQFVNNATGTVRATNNAALNFGGLALTSHGGLFEADAGSSIDYSGPNNRFNDGTRFIGLNRVSGSARFVDTIASDDLRFISGTQIGGDGVTADSRARLSGVVGFEGGDLSGAWEIKAGAVMTGSGAGTKRQVGSDIINNGTFRWVTTQTLQGGNGSVFANNGLVEVSENALFNWNFGGQHQFVNNATGTVRATNNAALNFGGLALTSHGGLFEADAGSSIEYSGPNNRFNDGTRFVGLNRVTGSARFVGDIASDNLRFVSGTQIGGDGSDGSFGRLTDQVAWQAGDLNGQFEIASGATLTANTAGSKRQVGSLLVNNGTILWSSDDSLQGGNSSRLVNNGRLEIASDADVTWNFGGQARLDNDGLLIKSAGAGDTSMANLALTNTGVIDVRSGSISLPANFVNDGTLTGTGTFNVVGTLLNNGHIAPGASPGTLTINGAYQQSALGTLDIELENTLSHDLLLISGNTTLAGTLGLSCFAICSYAVDDEIVILDAVGQLTGSFASVVMSGFASGAFDVVYDTVNDRVLLRVTETVTSAVPVPGAAVLMLGGLLALGGMARRKVMAA